MRFIASLLIDDRYQGKAQDEECKHGNDRMDDDNRRRQALLAQVKGKQQKPAQCGDHEQDQAHKLDIPALEQGENEHPQSGSSEQTMQ